MNLLRTKSIEQSIADTEEPTHQLRRRLGPLELIVFGVGVIIGTGIFVLTGKPPVSRPARPSLSFVFAGIACALAALCYAEFASTVPVAGSAYTFSYASLGEVIAWIIGWDLILELALGASTVAIGWSTYFADLMKSAGVTIPAWAYGNGRNLVAAAIVAILTAVLCFGITVSSRVNMVMVTIKIVIVLFVIVAGLFYIRTSNYSPFIPPSGSPGAPGSTSVPSVLQDMGFAPGSFGVSGIFTGAALVFFAFIGFDIVATTAEETKNPQRDVPRGILASLVIVTVLYVAVAVVLSGMVRYTELRDAGEKANLATAFAANGIDWAAKLISIGALAGLTTVVIVLVLGQTRVLFAMCRDGLLPRPLARTGPHGTPVRITVLVGVLVAITASVFPIGKLEEMVNIGTLFAFVLVSAGVIVLRRTRPDLERGFRAPGVPLLPVASIVACVWLMLNLTGLTWIRFLIWMAIGVLIYFAYGRTHSVLALRESATSAR